MIALLMAGAAPAGASVGPAWQLTPTGSEARLRGLSVVDGKTVWASGSLGTVLRTTDGGRTWASVGPPGTEALQFRDIEAFDANTAVILSIGNGEDSRIYRTSDGGKTWTESFRNLDAKAFYDCIAFFDRRTGLALSDPVDGKFRILSTSDGGRSWNVLPGDGMPAAQPAEFAFAASGQCLVTARTKGAGNKDAWIATGGDAKARVFHSKDRGRTWTVSDTPLRSGPSAGVFSVAFRDSRTGIAIGGDFDPANETKDAVARTGDGGATWRKPPQAPKGYRSGATYVPYLPFAIVAVGPTGSDLSIDGGNHWHQFDSGSFDTVDCGWDASCWAAGEQGRIAKLRQR
ncbi:Oxidoreductase (Secreted protein) [Kibdelosporangium sp. 4NS15]|uniref:Oxidoreductase (Secreted protein) n=1 Tax=Kibdelosporangium persicum TaxID=2698649 RepID=A0ABX2F655_9PSEU|nr:Oxidoreductase (Secreted protein) [Kibdelosporangium persicum]